MIARGSSNSRIYSLVMPLRNRETAANYLSSVDSLKTLINENENVIDELFSRQSRSSASDKQNKIDCRICEKTNCNFSL